MIQVTGLKKQFHGTDAVAGLDFSVAGGSITALIGPNGAGKSTTFQCIGGVLVPTSGQIHLNGQSMWAEKSQARQELGYVPQEPALFPMLTAQEYLDYLTGIGGGRGLDPKRQQDLIRRLGLEPHQGQLIRNCSGGTVRKLAALGAFWLAPRHLVLDEIFNGLDPESTIELKAILRELAQEGAAILISSHVLDLVERLCDQILIMVRGQLKSSLCGEELVGIRAQHGLEEAFARAIRSEGLP